MEKIITIYGNVPSSKNSREIVQVMSRYGTRKHKVIASSLVRKYIDKTELQWIAGRKQFIKLIDGYLKPYRITMKFIRDSHIRFDLINAAQIIQDMMVKYEWIPDDNADIIIPVFLGYKYIKNDGAVEIGIDY